MVVVVFCGLKYKSSTLELKMPCCKIRNTFKLQQMCSAEKMKRVYLYEEDSGYNNKEKEYDKLLWYSQIHLSMTIYVVN